MDDPCSASLVSQIFSGNAILCAQKASLIAKGKADIQGVVDNVDKYYQGQQTVIDATHEFAEGQQALVEGDVNAITNLNASTCDGVDLTLLGVGCLEWTFLEEVAIGVGLAALVLIGLYVYAISPKGR